MGLIMGFILPEIAKAALLGVLAWVLVPIVATMAAPDHELTEKIIGAYHTTAISILGRALFITRSHGGFRLKKTVFDPTENDEKAYVGGEEKHWKDPDNMMSTWRGYPFGLAHEDRNVIYDARFAHFARRYIEDKRRGTWEVDGLRKAYIALEAGRRYLVDPSAPRKVIQTQTSPGLSSRLKVFTEKGNALFNSRNVLQTTAWLMALGAGLGLMWLAAEFRARSSNAGGGGIIINQPVALAPDPQLLMQVAGVLV